MNYRYIALILGVITVSLLCAGCVSETPVKVPAALTYYTEQYPPYNYEDNGTLKGIAVDLLIDLTGRMGSPVTGDQIKIVPWTEGYQKALEDSNVILFSTVRLPEREDLFKWAGPIATENKVLFATSDSNIQINEPSDLKGYRIGVVTDDAAIGELTALGLDPENFTKASDISAVFDLLLNKEVDLLAYGKEAGEYALQEKNTDSSAVKVVWRMNIYDLWYAFSKDTPDSVVNDFQNVLDDVKNIPDETGVTEYQDILSRYIKPGYAQQTVTQTEALRLVNITALDLKYDTERTIGMINAGENPYRDEKNPAKYVFVYDTNVTIVADGGNPGMAGLNLRGITDVEKTPFRDQIVKGALENGSGEVDYVWFSPAESGLFYKTAYYTLTEGTDGKKYIVCCGIYKSSP